jgi:NADH-quinone oxidoreductase subunit G
MADVPIYFADALVRRAEALQQTHDARAPEVRINARTAGRLGLADGDAVRVRQGGGAAELPLKIDDAVADGVARVAAAHASTSGLATQFGWLELEKAGVA